MSVERLPQRHVAGGKAAHQGADAVLHLDAGKAQCKGGLHILQPVVDEHALLGLERILVQQGLVDLRVRLVDVYLAEATPPSKPSSTTRKPICCS